MTTPREPELKSMGRPDRAGLQVTAPHSARISSEVPMALPKPATEPRWLGDEMVG